MSRITVPTEELSDYKEFARTNPELTLAQYAWMQLSPDLLIGTAELLTPEFVSYEGGIFFARGFDETRFKEWYIQLNGDMEQIERLVNHKHIRGVIQFRPTDSIAVVRVVADLLQKFWSYSLNEQFPNVKYAIDICDDADENDCTLTIYRKRQR